MLSFIIYGSIVCDYPNVDTSQIDIVNEPW